ncbi:MAG: LysR family transcriptional regulator [Marivibrio sp.]|uniref:LysR family transcriptional regulator n=1 Tax=Marivibrio sp. TaxID=2039719 RepID=UPI0032EE0984
MAVTLNAFRVFAATARSGSVSRAAAAVRRTPSAVSMTLKQLEEAIGRPLFDGERKTRLTPTGRLALAEAEAALDRFDRATEAIRAFAAAETGRLSLSVTPSVAEQALPAALAAFRAARPRVEILLRDTDSANVAADVAEEAAEIGIAGPPDPADPIADGLAFRPLFRDAIGLAVRCDDPLADLHRPVRWADLDGRTLLTHAVAGEIPAARAPSEDAPLRALTVTSALALVRAGLGVTILPRLVAPTGESDLIFLEMAPDAAPRRTVGLITKRDRPLSPAAEAALVEIERALDALAARLGAAFERL